MAEADWRRIESIVRPQRYALLINDVNYWHHTCQRAIEVFTQLWGGAGFIIVPTDGQTISEPLWNILENYSPDYLGCYYTTLRDLKWAAPDEYARNIENIRSQLSSTGNFDEERIQEFIDQQERQIHINELSLSEGLKKELVDRLSPFHYSRVVDRHSTAAEQVPDFPFTQVQHIIPHSKQKPEVVYRHKELSNPIFNLMAKMKVGAITESFQAEIEPSGIEVSNALDAIEDKDYLHDIEVGEVDNLRRSIQRNESSVPTDYMSHLPNSLSLTGLGSYFKLESGRIEQENVTVVIGDKLEDFCFAFSLSKMLRNVHWLPDTELRGAYTSLNQAVRAAEHGDEVAEQSENTLIVRDLCSIYSSKIGYGSAADEKKIVYTSISLSSSQLIDRRAKVNALAYVGVSNLQSRTYIRSANKIDVTYISRLLEMNNYANEQAIAFVNGEGVERLHSIKPKNFNYIDPSHHRWIQTVLVKGFNPPVLPGLGTDIFKNQSARYEVRVGTDGIAYLLPGIAYFVGNDIDTTLSRPEIKVLSSTEIFAHYFAEHYMILPSDKGRYFSDSVEKFGGLDETAKFFKNRKYNKLLDLFTKDRRNDEESHRDERILLEYSGRSYLNLKSVQKALGRGYSAGNIVDYLLSIEVLRRGLILQCQKCACSAWYDNDNIGQEFECSRCRTKRLILKDNWKKPDEPSWYYSLAETVYQFYKSNSHITLLGLSCIKGKSENFQYLPELELRELSDNGRKLEIDFACLKDGKIYLGEAKNRKLETNDLSKYITLNNLLNPKPYKVVFAANYHNVPLAVRTRIKTSGLSDKTQFVLSKELYN